MLADIVKKLTEYVKKMPFEGPIYYSDDVCCSVIGIRVNGQFERLKGAEQDVLKYSGTIDAYFVEDDQCAGENVDPYNYGRMSDTLNQIKRFIHSLIIDSGIPYELRGLDFNSSNIWFTLERKLGRDAADSEVSEIRSKFPNARETYEP